MYRVLILSALFAVTASASTRPELDASRYGWFADYSAGKAEAGRTGKPILLVFRCEP